MNESGLQQNGLAELQRRLILLKIGVLIHAVISDESGICITDSDAVAVAGENVFRNLNIGAEVVYADAVAVVVCHCIANDKTGFQPRRSVWIEIAVGQQDGGITL